VVTAPLLSILLERLRSFSCPNGGYASFPDQPARADSTALAALALHAAGHAGEAKAAALQLASHESTGGGVSLFPAVSPSAWPTGLAMLAWRTTSTCPDSVEKAGRFLLQESKSQDQAHQAVTESGWSWNQDNYSWVVPTSYALLGLRAAGQGTTPRCQTADLMLLGRQIQSGGWNYGNNVVLGTELLPLADTTGLALVALRDATPSSTVAQSLTWSQSALAQTKSPFAAAWLYMGLVAWSRDTPADRTLLEHAVSAHAGDPLLGCEAVAASLIALAHPGIFHFTQASS
jgi:hypothetical protein